MNLFKKTNLILFSLAFGLSLFSACTKDDLSPESEFVVNEENTKPSEGNLKTQIVPLTMQDCDGNTYNTVVIGNQIWMAENLKTTLYRYGDPITKVENASIWSDYSTTGKYCWYNNDINNKDEYGALYNWYAVMDARVLAPEGFHVPTLSEVQTLVSYLGGSSVAGGKMKETGTAHWSGGNSGATNESGFTARAGGDRSYNQPGFEKMGSSGTWWTSTSLTGVAQASANMYQLNFYPNIFVDAGGKFYGYSVRCVSNFQAAAINLILPVTNITSISANVSANITSDGGTAVLERGVCYSETTSPTVDGTHVADMSGGTGSFIVNLSSLNAGKTYYIRAYARTKVCIVYSDPYAFPTPPPSCSTTAIINSPATSITSLSATVTGNVTSTCSITERGVCYSTNHNPTITPNSVIMGSGSGAISCNLTGLTPNNIYYARTYAVTSTSEVIYSSTEVAFTTNDIPIPTNGLVAYYPFNGNANDLSGYGNKGTVYGAALTTNRKGTANSAYSFDGINDYILVANSASICPSSAVTVSAWVNATGLVNRHCVVNKRIHLTAAPYDSYGLFASNATSSQKWMGTLTANSTQTNLTSPTVTSTNRWYHLVLTYDGYTESLYVDGVLVSSTSKTGAIKYSSMGLYFGTSALNTNYMKGKIDDIRIYNRALNPAEIQSLFNE